MTVIMLVPFLLLFFNINITTGIPASVITAPEFPSTYYYQAEQIDLIEGKVIPYKFWTDDDLRRNRITYYDGTDSKYLIKKERKAIRVYYKSDENGDGAIQCSYIKFFSGEPVSTYLPEVTQYKFIGEKYRRNMIVQVYQTESEGFMTSMSLNGSLPVKYEIKFFGRNGGLSMHRIINYFDYKTEVNSSDLMLDESNCDSFIDDNKSDQRERSHDGYDDVDKEFNEYISNHKKSYTEDEREMRKKIFLENWRLIKDHNKKNSSFKLTLNQFADRTHEEMRVYEHGLLSDEPDTGSEPFPHTEEEIQKLVENIPEEFDWRIEGKVSKVKSQGSCGSCWAFAAAAALEGAFSIKYGTNFDLSEQAIVDCAWAFDMRGCNGGYDWGGYQFVMKHGIPTEEEYGEYSQTDGKCHIKNSTRLFKIKSYGEIKYPTVNAVKYAIYKYGPLSVSMRVSPKMRFYRNGILNEISDPADGTGHAVSVVGYGVTDGVPYWIVKNSWGENWGEDGYILIASLNNAANILVKPPRYPIV